MDILDPHKHNYLQTENKEFDDLEERFHCVSLCVTEMKNNVAVYLDNLEVSILQLIMDGAGWFPQASGAYQTSWQSYSCRKKMENVIQWLVVSQKKGQGQALLV